MFHALRYDWWRKETFEMFHAWGYIGWEIENFENVPRSEIYWVGRTPGRLLSSPLFLKVSSAKRKVHISREKETKGEVHIGGEKKTKRKVHIRGEKKFIGIAYFQMTAFSEADRKKILESLTSDVRPPLFSCKRCPVDLLHGIRIRDDFQE